MGDKCCCITSWQQTKKVDKLKFIILLFILLLGEKASAQSDVENMKKYSYHTVGVLGNKAEIGGTGFFLKKGAKFYFVSAWHCFSFKNHISKNYENPKAPLIKDIIVYRNLKDIGTNDYLRIQLSDSITSKPKYLSIYQKNKLLDISAIEIEWSSTYKFDFYEFKDDFNSTQANITDKVFYYGYPIINGKQNDLSEYYNGTITDINKELDEYTIKITGYTGCSGSPLFIEKDNKPILIGVIFYALKDYTGKASYCKSIDIKYLINNLK